jgi:hypothetical protein
VFSHRSSGAHASAPLFQEAGMANDGRTGDSKFPRTRPDQFGTCCEELRDAIEGDGFDPLITVGDDGILYAAVGLVELEDDEPGMIDHPVFFCPFCGQKLQDKEVVSAQIASEGELQQ